MKLDISEQSLPVYEALASRVRLTIIQLLAKQSMNIKELAEALNLSSAIMTKHVKKLELAGLIRSEMVPSRGGMQKKCLLNEDYIEILFPSKAEEEFEFIEQEVSIGHFTDFKITPTCGLATQDKIIGEFDEPRYFLDPERVHAKILWFGEGYVEYKIPNFLHSKFNPIELDISMEIASEAPSTNDNWPSDISFYLNHHFLGKWTSPGDYGDRRGKFTPSWWPSEINQYGLLKHLRINSNGTFMDGKLLSSTTIRDINIEEKLWTFRISLDQDSINIGGVTLFGSGFGNYNQDLRFRLFYR